MTDINTLLLQQRIRHAVDLTRYENGVVQDIIALLNDAERDLLAQLMKRLDKEATWTNARLKAIFVDMAQLNADNHKEAAKRLAAEMVEFASHEAEQTAHAIESVKPSSADLPAPVAKQIDLAFTMTLPTAEQLAAIVSKEPITVGADGKLLLEEIFSKLAAGKEEKIRQAVRLGMSESETVDQIVRRLRGTRAARFTDGVFQANRRNTEAMTRTIVMHTSNRAAAATYRANEDVIKGIRWCSTLDKRTTPVCQARDGHVYPVDTTTLPPAHVNCLPGDSLVLPRSRVLAASKRWFDGYMVVIKTASGRIFTSTPNHPVLTPSGWVAAGLLNVGGNVISDGGSEWGSVVDGNDKDMPTRIEDIAEAFFNSSEVLTRPVPMTAKDFHGDGGGSKIAVVGADRELWFSGNPAVKEQTCQLSLILRNNMGAAFSAFYKFVKRVFPASHSIVGRLSKLLAFFRRHTGHTSKLLFAPVAGGNPVLAEQLAHVGARNAEDGSNALDTNAPVKQFFSSAHINSGGLSGGFESDRAKNTVHLSDAALVFFRNLLRRKAALVLRNSHISGGGVASLDQGDSVHPQNVINASDRASEGFSDDLARNTAFIHRDYLGGFAPQPQLSLFGFSSDADAPVAEQFSDMAVTDSELARDLASGRTCDVFTDNIISVERREFHGHVYNLQTESNWYVANGVVSHNCRSFTTPVLKSWKELGVPLSEMPESTRASMGGQVPESTDYPTWLKGYEKTHPGTAKDILGPARAELFLSGKLDIKDFVDDKGKVLNLKQLAEVRAKRQ